MELSMILMIDMMGERYKMLPSEIMNKGSTFDLYVMDAAVSYYNYQHKKANGEIAVQPTQEELLEMIKKVKK